MNQIMTLEGLDQGITVKQVAQENPLLTQLLAGSILVMFATLIGSRKARTPRF
jgi:hypothetical protein